jgi:periplasmic divalent cation tolerance protein
VVSPPGSDEALSLVVCNAPPDKAEDIARAVLDKRLCACVNVIPGVVSLYWWQGGLCRDAEATLLMKTRTALVPELTRALRAVHPYDVPEVIALPIDASIGNPAYLAWVRAETTPRV